VQSTGSTSPDSISAESDSPAPSSLSSQCDPSVDLVGWEEGGEGENGTTTTTTTTTATAADVTVAAKAEEAKAKTGESFGVVDEKASPDVVSQPAGEPLPP
jgi:hypothetical protein